ncbi:MAG: hypothetical protein WA322_12900 [Pseudolabrys sp.]
MTKLPMLAQTDVDAMVDTVVGWVDRVAAILTSEAGRLRLRNDIRERLRQGTIPTMQVIKAARAGHEDADWALRKLIAEMIDRNEDLPTTLAGYTQEALFRAPVTYPPGHNIADYWLRDIGIAVMVDLAKMHWPFLKATRNPASKRPSASTIVCLALRKHGVVQVTEGQVGRIYGNHRKLAARLSASMGDI